MAAILKILIILKALAVFGFLAPNAPTWTFEMLALDFENLTPDVVEINFYMSLFSRGIYKVSGEIDIKQDLTDEFHVEADVFYSATGSNNYIRTPFRITKCNLSDFANNYYRRVFMDALRNCSTNSPYFEANFEPPVTKRLMTLDNCLASNENMPSHLKSGYYRLIFRYSNQASGSLSFDARIEAD